MEKIGLFGGTFDPFHYGHYTIVKQFVIRFGLDLCYLIPAKISPFKQYKINMLTDKERLAQFNQLNSDKWLVVSDYEIRKEGISYSCDTVKYFRDLHPAAELYMLIGTDQAIQFDKWKNYLYILENVKIVIATRPEKLTGQDKAKIEEIFQGKYKWLNNEIIPITSSQIRNDFI